METVNWATGESVQDQLNNMHGTVCLKNFRPGHLTAFMREIQSCMAPLLFIAIRAGLQGSDWRSRSASRLLESSFKVGAILRSKRRMRPFLFRSKWIYLCDCTA